MAETAQLSDFDDQLYKLQTGDKTEEKDELYLIATSEQPLSGYHRGEWMERDQLPQRYAGFSTCFRKEAGAHGKDVWGIFRVHQFEKIEQFCITTPEKSWEEHEKMCAVSEEFLQSLGLPYRVWFKIMNLFRLSILYLKSSTLLLLRSMTLKPGSQDMKISENWSVVLTALTTNQEILTSDSETRKQ